LQPVRLVLIRQEPQPQSRSRDGERQLAAYVGATGGNNDYPQAEWTLLRSTDPELREGQRALAVWPLEVNQCFLKRCPGHMCIDELLVCNMDPFCRAPGSVRKFFISGSA